MQIADMALAFGKRAGKEIQQWMRA